MNENIHDGIGIGKTNPLTRTLTKSIEEAFQKKRIDMLIEGAAKQFDELRAKYLADSSEHNAERLRYIDNYYCTLLEEDGNDSWELFNITWVNEEYADWWYEKEFPA
jgi:hypothetical protein